MLLELHEVFKPVACGVIKVKDRWFYRATSTKYGFVQAARLNGQLWKFVLFVKMKIAVLLREQDVFLEKMLSSARFLRLLAD